MSTAAQVAEWMAKEVRANGELFQKAAAATIADTFSGGHVYPNPKGNLAISKAVLTAFRERTKNDVLWIRGKRFWRLREAADGPGRLHNP
jgi:hypothetical protein